MSDPASDLALDAYRDVLGIDLPPARLAEVLQAFRGVLEEIQKLRQLDLTDVHPAVIFEPTAIYRKELDR